MASNYMVCVDDFEQYAKGMLSSDAVSYYYSGACDEITSKENKEAFSRYRLLPRVLRDVSVRSTETTILGHRVDFPMGIAPTALHKMAHPLGEVATVKAAAAMGAVLTLSTYATCSIQEVSEAASDCLKFFQLYISEEEDHQITKILVRKAEQWGYKAIVLTVDTACLGLRYSDIRLQTRVPPHLRVCNLVDAMDELSTKGKRPDLNDCTKYSCDASITWDSVRWLQSFTTLPIILKGILSAADAALAAECGVAAVWVSNHGGRQLDTAPATIDVLPSVVRAVAGRCEVYLDGGVRRGTDVFKAIALGARAVFIGTPVLSGLAYNGQAGVQQVLGILKNELSTAMGLSGCASLTDIKPELVLHESQYMSRL